MPRHQSRRRFRPTYDLDLLFFKQDIPESVLSAWRSHRQVEYLLTRIDRADSFSPETRAYGFVAEVHRLGGDEAVAWLRRNRIVARRIIRRFNRTLKTKPAVIVEPVVEYTRHEAAEVLGISVSTLDRWAREQCGPFKHHEDGRVFYLSDEVEAWQVSRA